MQCNGHFSRRLPRAFAATLCVLSTAPCLAAVAAPFIPNDPQFIHQWYLLNSGQMVNGNAGTPGADIAITDAWSIHRGAGTVTVAIVGSGVDPHSEFADRLLEGGAVVGDPYDSRDGCGASTRAAGLIGAAVNDASGIAGIDGSVTLLPIRVLTGCSGSELNLANGIRRAVDEDADVIITPVQFYGGSQALADAVQYATDHDVVIVAPVGYDQGDSVAYPAGFNDCLAVAASDANDAIAAWSNRGPEVALSAPGTFILMTDLNDGYIELDQAWFAPAAQVAGAAALLRSYAPQLTAVEIADLLMNSAEDLGAPGHDEFFGAGRLNVAGALTIAPLPGLRIEPSGTVPNELPPEAPHSFTVRIVNAGQSLLAGSALLWQRSGGGAFTSKPLVSLGGGNFRTDLSAFPCDAEVEFYLTAQGNGGAAVELPRTAPDRVYRAIARDESIIFTDDFETDAGWQTAPVGASGSVGAWTRGLPNGSLSGNTPVQTAWDFSPDAGTACFFTGQYTPGAGIGTSDVDGGPFVLTSPVVAIAAPDVEIRYAAWLYWNGVGVEDVLTAEFSRDGGTNWTLADTVHHTSGWTRRAFRLSQFPAVTGNQLQVRFSVSDIPLDSLTEAAIDEVQFAALFCSAIRGDIDADGRITLIDYAGLFDCWNGPDGTPGGANCAAVDFDFNQTHDLLDAAAFQNAFTGP